MQAKQKIEASRPRFTTPEAGAHDIVGVAKPPATPISLSKAEIVLGEASLFGVRRDREL